MIFIMQFDKQFYLSSIKKQISNLKQRIKNDEDAMIFKCPIANDINHALEIQKKEIISLKNEASKEKKIVIRMNDSCKAKQRLLTKKRK